MKSSKADRPCSVCGMFYPGDADELRRNITQLISSTAFSKYEGIVRGIVGPHAGYLYSGFTAAHAYARLQGSYYSSVVVVSPSHREYFDGVSVFPGDSYCTPLGVIPVDDCIREKLLEKSTIVTSSYAGHGEEHAIEVHLPFLQHVLGEFKLVPVVIGDQNRENCFALGEALGKILAGEDVLLVASTDLSHYHPATIADKLDAVVIDHVRKFDYESLMSDLESRRAEACGGGPTVAVMLALHRMGVSRIEVLHHCNSGDVTGDSSQVVGYLSAAAYA